MAKSRGESEEEERSDGGLTSDEVGPGIDPNCSKWGHEIFHFFLFCRVSERRGKSQGNASVCFSRRMGGPVMICRFDKNPEYCRGGKALVTCEVRKRDMCNETSW